MPGMRPKVDSMLLAVLFAVQKPQNGRLDLHALALSVDWTNFGVTQQEFWTWWHNQDVFKGDAF